MFGNKQKRKEKAYNKALKLCKKDKIKGAEKMRELSQKGNDKAAVFMYLMTLDYAKRTNDPKFVKEYYKCANEYLKIAADNGNVDAQYELAKTYETGNGVARNDRMAFEYYLMAAQNGDAKAQTNVSRFYTLGIGVEHNAKEAVYWKLEAAKQGETIAMCNIANGYENGKGVEKSNDEAIAWYKRALERARYLLETNGDGIREYSEKNEKNAIDLATKGIRRMEIQIACEDFRKMKSEYLRETALKKIEAYANEGEWRAQFEMGLIHENEKDYAGAMRWYELASNNGSSGAMANIACIYYYGKGVPKDYEMAYKWFKKAVDYAANTFSMYMLGWMYEQGIYVGKNIDTAVSWYRKAAMQGSKDATKRLKDIGY